jgi:Tol biopolymer transport system component/tRNA A-37 threonylcarbamoyl transferase component Bud32
MNSRLLAALAPQYRIESELGQGGMATVYLAHDLKHERQVAVKVLREDLSASLGSGRFLREIKIAAQLQHPHILPLLDSGEADGFLYFVMPYIKGQSLRERIAREGELPVHDAVRLLLEVVDALVEAHAHGVVHRDIKPDNVMLSGRHALVTDFGVAKAISEATGGNMVTTLGVAVGTPTYMSPEQAAADPHVDHRSDIYSIGVMAYEMLSGRPPFVGNSPQQVLAAHVTEAPDNVSKRRPAIPDALEQIVMRCLAKRPADRFQTAAELHLALEPMVTSGTGLTPTQVRPVSGAAARHRTPIIVAVALMTVAAGAFAFLRGSRPPVPAPITEQVTTTGKVATPSISPDGTRIAYAVSRCDAEGHCLFDAVVQDLGGSGTLTVFEGATGIYYTWWSPDGRYLSVYAGMTDHWGTFIVPATVQGPPVYRGCCEAMFLTTSDTLLRNPPGQPGDTVNYLRVETARDGVLRDSIRMTKTPESGTFITPSPDGKRIAISISDEAGRFAGVVRLIDRSGRVTDSIEVGIHGFPVWTPDSRGLVLALAQLGILDATTLVQRRIDKQGRFSSDTDTLWTGVKIRGLDVAMSGDATVLAYAGVARTSRVVTLRRPNLGSVQFVERTVSSSTGMLGGGISPDGQSVLLIRVHARVGGRLQWQLSLIPADSGQEVLASPVLDTLTDGDWHWGSPDVPTYSFPEGKSGTRVALFEPSSGQSRLIATLPDSLNASGYITLPGNRFLRLNGRDREYTIWSDLGALELRFKLPEGLANVVASSISPAGDEVALLGYNRTNSDSVVVYRVSLSDGRGRQVGAVIAERPSDGFRWIDNGDLLAVIGESRANYSLYRIGATGGLVRVGAVPYAMGASYTISADGLTFGVTVVQPNSDAWLVKNFGEMWQR